MAGGVKVSSAVHLWRTDRSNVCSASGKPGLPGWHSHLPVYGRDHSPLPHASPAASEADVIPPKSAELIATLNRTLGRPRDGLECPWSWTWHLPTVLNPGILRGFTRFQYVVTLDR